MEIKIDQLVVINTYACQVSALISGQIAGKKAIYFQFLQTKFTRDAHQVFKIDPVPRMA